VSEVFDSYARYYDLLYRDKDYAAEVEYIVGKIREYCPSGARILELGCGTGLHAEYLARQGFQVDGIDMSIEMLARANSRKAALSPELSARLSFSQGDVRSVRTNKKYDVVISLFHVMSYQTSNVDLAAAFTTAAAHLSVDGVFMFDYWYGPAVLLQRPEARIKHLSDEQIDVVRTAEPTLRLEENIVDVNYSVNIKVKATGEVREITELHSMRYLFLPEISLFSDSKDWHDCVSTAWMKDASPISDDWAGFSVMRRK
jgi:SAM-dependent methyltransferase